MKNSIQHSKKSFTSIRISFMILLCLFLLNKSSIAKNNLAFIDNATNIQSVQQNMSISNGFTDVMGIKLMNMKSDGTIVEVDGVRAKYALSYSAVVDANDAVKWTTPGTENLSLIRETKLLSIEARPYILDADSLFLNISNLAVGGNYQLKFSPANFDSNALICKLVDKFLNTETVVNLGSISIINFSVNAASGSFDANRFFVKYANSSSLSDNNITVKAYKQSNNVIIDWQTQAENNVKNYIVEKSIDGSNFNAFATTIEKNNKLNIGYRFIDNHPAEGVNYYRVAARMLSNNILYSAIAKLEIDNKGIGSVGVFPNPVKGNTLGLQMNNIKAGKYSLKLFNNIGGLEWSSEMDYTSNNNLKLQFNKTMRNGVYQLQITNENGSCYKQTIMILE